MKVHVLNTLAHLNISHCPHEIGLNLAKPWFYIQVLVVVNV